MATTSTKPRLLSLDLMRGYFLVVIILDHLGRWGSPFEFVTGRGHLWVSAAEGFFFISGLLVGLTSIRKISQIGFRPIWLKLWRRSLLLYVLGVAGTLIFTWIAFRLGWAPKVDITSSRDWSVIIPEALRLVYVYGWQDFLPRYAIYMFFAPLAGYLISRGLWWSVLWTSILIWLWKGQVSFNSAWQVVFFSGMIVGYYFPQIKACFNTRLSPRLQKLSKGLLVSVAAIGLVISYIINIGPQFLYDYSRIVDPLWNHFSDLATKQLVANTLTTWSWSLEPFFSHGTMGLGRFGFFLIAFAALFVIVQRYDRLITRYAGWLLLPFGRNSLLTYMVHAVVIFTIDTLIPRPTDNIFLFHTLHAILALALVWISVNILLKLRLAYNQMRATT